MGVNNDNVDDVFMYHAPTDDQIVQYHEVREAGKTLANAILGNTPVCADQQAAIRHVREAVMTANAAIALGGKV